MATEILATGSGAATSSDVVIASGSTLTVGLKGVVDGAALVNIQIYDGAAYITVGTLSPPSPSDMVKVLDGPGTYRFVRGGTSICGVFSG